MNYIEMSKECESCRVHNDDPNCKNCKRLKECESCTTKISLPGYTFKFFYNGKRLTMIKRMLEGVNND